MFKRDYLGYKAYMRNSLSYLDLLLVIFITRKAFKKDRPKHSHTL